MPSRLQEALRQSRPFASRQVEAYLNLVRTTDALSRGLAALLRERRLSIPQYNALRILRGAGPDGRTCGEIGERMVSRDPDITRLLDRLEKRGLVARERQTDDRRVVRARITPAGLDELAALEAPLDQLHVQQLGHLSEPQLAALIELLELAREPHEAPAAPLDSAGLPR